LDRRKRNLKKTHIHLLKCFHHLENATIFIREPTLGLDCRKRQYSIDSHTLYGNGKAFGEERSSDKGAILSQVF